MLTAPSGWFVRSITINGTLDSASRFIAGETIDEVKLKQAAQKAGADAALYAHKDTRRKALTAQRHIVAFEKK